MSYAEIHSNISGCGRNRPGSKQRKQNLQRLRQRDGDNCWICGNLIDFSLPRDHIEAGTLDHRIPFSRGGSNHIDNLRLAHRICGEKRGNPKIND